MDIKYFILQYDKKEGIKISIDNYININIAMKTLKYLEDLYTKDLSKEVVLIGVPIGEEDYTKTHIRYFVYRGVPMIPENLEFSLNYPDSKKLASNV